MLATPRMPDANAKWNEGERSRGSISAVSSGPKFGLDLSKLGAEQGQGYERKKRRHISVFVHVRCGWGTPETEFVLKCGRGTQTLKWLAIVASQRYADVAQRGRIRCREQCGGKGGPRLTPRLGGRSARCQLIPTNLVSAEEPGCDPKKRIRDCFCDGDHVYVTLDGVGKEQTFFTVEAFVNNPDVKNMKEKECEDAASRVVQKEHSRAQSAMSMQYSPRPSSPDRRLSVSRHSPRLAETEGKSSRPDARYGRGAGHMMPARSTSPRPECSLAALEDDVDWMIASRNLELEERKLSKMFDREWEQIELEDLISRRADRLRVRRVLSQHYALLRKMFRSYAIIALGEDCELSATEFTEICVKSNLMDSSFTVDEMDQVFQDVNEDKALAMGMKSRSRAVSTVPDTNLQLFEFLEALVRISAIKFRGRGKPADQLQMLLHTSDLLSHAQQISKRKRLHAFEDIHVQKLISKRMTKLKKIYQKYSHDDDNEHSRALSRCTMSLLELEMIIDDAGLRLDASRSRTELTRVYNQSQMAQASESSMLQEDADDELSFPEFLECLVRVSLRKFAELPNETEFGKIKMGVEQMASLYDRKR